MSVCNLSSLSDQPVDLGGRSEKYLHAESLHGSGLVMITFYCRNQGRLYLFRDLCEMCTLCYLFQTVNSVNFMFRVIASIWDVVLNIVVSVDNHVLLGLFLSVTYSLTKM